MIIVDVGDVYMTVDDLFEYQGRPFTGRAREYSPEGVLIGEMDYVDGMLDGVSRGWYPSGQLQEEEHFRANGRHGPSRQWYENGTLQRETLWEHSIRVRERQWNEKGELTRDYVLSEDKPMFRRLEQLRRTHDRLDARTENPPEPPQ